MIPVVDRVPTYPGRVKITKENGGTVEYVTWERADEPTEEGTPINKALFDSIQADLGLSENVTICVSPSGSDTLGDGSEANPYATINKAVSTIPKNLGGFDARVHLASGTYNEDVEVEHFSNGRLLLAPTSGAQTAVTIKTITVHNSHYVQITQSITLTVGTSSNGKIYVDNNGVLLSTGNITINSGSSLSGIETVNNALFVNSATVTIKNAGTAVRAGGTIRFNVLAGSGNGTGIHAIGNGKVTFSSATDLAATTRLATSSGGRIYAGAQTSIPNY